MASKDHGIHSFEECVLEDDFEKIVEECEDLECRDHTVILYKGLSNKRTS